MRPNKSVDVGSSDQSDYLVTTSGRTIALSIETDESHKRGWIVAASHILTAIIGAGVLGLPYAISWLGWPAGVALLLLFFGVTLVCSFMLADVFEVDGRRHNEYGGAVRSIIGARSALVVASLQYINLVLAAVGYTVAAGQSASAIVRHNVDACRADGDSPGGYCPDQVWLWILLFGAVQLPLSQLPNLESMWVVSVLGAVMSVGYSTLALGMGAAAATAGNATLSGRSAPAAAKALGAFNSLGAIAFAYSFSALLLEIQDTLPSKPPPARAMRRAVSAALALTLVFYIGVGVSGYAALGDVVPPDVLAGLEGPRWVVTGANAMVLLHMVAAFQVFSQPVFLAAESALTSRVRVLRGLSLPRLRLLTRPAYVAACVALAASAPSFTDVIGLVGALVFWPVSVHFPVAMYAKVHNPQGWRRTAMTVMDGGMLVVAVLATIGAVQDIVVKYSGGAAAER